MSSGFHIDIDELESLKCRVEAIASAQRAIVRPAQPGAEVFGCDGIDDAIGVLLDGGRQRHQDGALWADHTAEVEVDGTRKTITIEAAHAYTVIAADNGGITISNPWGHNNEADGSGNPSNNKPQAGGTFRMSWDDYRRCFMSYTYGRIP